jgi:hypothetical protein
MGKLHSVFAGVFVAALIASSVRADGPDISAQRLLESWKGEDAGMRMVAEVIASSFASGFPGAGTPREGGFIALRRISRGHKSWAPSRLSSETILRQQSGPMARRWRRRLLRRTLAARSNTLEGSSEEPRPARASVRLLGPADAIRSLWHLLPKRREKRKRRGMFVRWCLVVLRGLQRPVDARPCNTERVGCFSA